MGGEGGAAHAHDTGLPDDGNELFRGERFHFLPGAGADILAERALVVVFDDYAHHGHTAGVGAGLHGLHCAGDRRVHRNAQALIITDLLTPFYGIVLFYQRLAGNADVLGHGHHQNIRLREFLHRQIPGVVLVVLGVHTAKERKRHKCFTSSEDWGIEHIYDIAKTEVCLHGFGRFAQNS